MSQITENKIKKATLRFLKTYYKFRPRTGETNVRYDVRSKTGIIADGHLSFPMEDGQSFVATFEATSYDTREEVRYRIQSRLLIWDSLAVGSILTAFMASYAYTFHRAMIKMAGLWMSLAALTLILILAYLVYYFLFRGLHKYRYIYAIEQFKRYHANEQWIEIGEDVFLTSEDHFFRELKDQCVLNGFGLISVDRDHEPQLLITPSRQEVFGSKRRMTSFVEQNRFADSFAGKTVKGWWGRLKSKLPGSKRMSEQLSLLRYRRTYFKQMLVSLIALGLITGIAFKEHRDQPIDYVDEEQYTDVMVAKKDSLGAETSYLFLDTQLIDPYKDQPAEYDRHVLLEEPEPAIENLSPYESALLELDANQTIRTDPSKEIVVSLEDGSKVDYNCERFYNIRTKVYVLQDRSYPTLEAAQQRIQTLKAADIMANLLWLGCFSKAERDFVVYLDFMFASKKEAISTAKAYEKELRRKKQYLDPLKIRSISRVNQ